MLVQRLRARAAGVRGNGAGEAFVQLLAQELHGRRRNMSTGRCASRAMRSFHDAAKLNFQEQAPWLSQLGQMDNTAVATEPTPYKRLEKALPGARQLHEPTHMEAADLAMCTLEKKRRRARLPLFASSRKPWQQDAQLPDKELRKSKRARAVLEEARLDAGEARKGGMGCLASPSTRRGRGTCFAGHIQMLFVLIFFAIAFLILVFLFSSIVIACPGSPWWRSRSR